MAIHLELGVCTIRPWRLTDAESLTRHANDRRVSRNLRDRFPFPYTRRGAEQYLAMTCGSEPATSYAVEVNGEAAGGIAYVPHDDVERIMAEVGYWLGVAHWGRRIMSAAVPAFSLAVFQERPDLRRLYAVPFAGNTASRRILERAGYRLEGRMRQSAIKDGEVMDQLLYALLRDELGDAHATAGEIGAP
jgi:ribosomal-protein-alanine N-acetyltransferase